MNLQNKIEKLFKLSKTILYINKTKLCERAEIGKQTGLKILRVVTPLWVQVPPLAPKKIMKLFFLTFIFLLQVNTSFANEMEEKMKKFILENPEIILKSLENYEIQLEKKQNLESRKKIIKYKSDILDSSNGLYSGNKKTQTSIIKFSDYNCSYCKKAHQDILKLKKQFPNIKIIYKNFPILSPLSEKLARISYLIANDDNKKFNIFHNALLSHKGPLNDKKVYNIIKDLGYDFEEIEKKLKSEKINEVLNKDIKLANNLELRGTPVFIINDKIFFGYVGYDAMAAALKN
tara:strand:+ start:57 stop:926 length:870 start_codon:yes stop_codon:yes gene_type:complete